MSWLNYNTRINDANRIFNNYKSMGGGSEESRILLKWLGRLAWQQNSLTNMCKYKKDKP